jgi:hypothetical protein
MNESLFIEFVRRIWSKLSLYVKEKVNYTNKTLTYLHKTMLTEVYSPDQKWEGTSANTTYVAADMVAMDSPLSPKMRDSIARSNGTLPKIGMKKKLKETDINAINIIKAHLYNATTDAARKSILNRIITRILDDGTACSIGIDERNEANFLTGLSDGVIIVEGDDDKNTGIGLRVDYGYLPEHRFGVVTTGEVTGDDIERVISKADDDGNSISVIMLALSTYNKMRQSQWAKELAANYRGQTFDNDTKLPVPTSTLFDEAFSDQYGGISFLKVDRSVTYEKNGKRVSYKPWNANKLIFLPSADNVGSFVWGTLAEATNPVNGVEYTTIDKYKLISRYSKTDPLQEFTNGQAICLPVIENVDQIYSLDILEAQTVDTTEEEKDTSDVKITIWGATYKKPEFVTEYNKIAGKNLTSTVSDDKLIAAVNRLSDADEEALKKAVESHKAS